MMAVSSNPEVDLIYQETLDPLRERIVELGLELSRLEPDATTFQAALSDLTLIGDLYDTIVAMATRVEAAYGSYRDPQTKRTKSFLESVSARDWRRLRKKFRLSPVTSCSV